MSLDKIYQHTVVIPWKLDGIVFFAMCDWLKTAYPNAEWTVSPGVGSEVCFWFKDIDLAVEAMLRYKE